MNEDKSTRFHRLRRRAGICAFVARVALLVALLGSSLSLALRDLSTEVVFVTGVPAAVRASAGVAVYALVLAVLGEVIVLPLTWYIGCVLERRYRLSHHLRGDWVRGCAKVTAVRLAVWTTAAVGVYVATRAWPVRWWLITGVMFGVTTILVTHLAPVAVLPWLYDLRPLRRPALRARLEALTRRVGAPAMRMFEWRVGREAPRANAALVGDRWDTPGPSHGCVACRLQR